MGGVAIAEQLLKDVHPGSVREAGNQGVQDAGGGPGRVGGGIRRPEARGQRAFRAVTAVGGRHAQFAAHWRPASIMRPDAWPTQQASRAEQL
jgi:hypothetical protein